MTNWFSKRTLHLNVNASYLMDKCQCTGQKQTHFFSYRLKALPLLLHNPLFYIYNFEKELFHYIESCSGTNILLGVEKMMLFASRNGWVIVKLCFFKVCSIFLSFIFDPSSDCISRLSVFCFFFCLLAFSTDVFRSNPPFLFSLSIRLTLYLSPFSVFSFPSLFLSLYFLLYLC